VIFGACSGYCAFCTGSESASPQIAGPSCGAVSAKHITTPFFARPKSQSTNAKEVSEHPLPPPPAQPFYERAVGLLSSSFRRSDSKTRTSGIASQVTALRRSNGHNLPEYSCLPPILVGQCNFSEEILTAHNTSGKNSATDRTYINDQLQKARVHLEMAKVAQKT
jgi:hypothetical protein